MDRTVLSHREYVYGLFAKMWRDAGGVFNGAMKVADWRPRMKIRCCRSSRCRLRDVISRINKHSNNVMARQLLYTLAAEAGWVRLELKKTVALSCRDLACRTTVLPHADDAY